MQKERIKRPRRLTVRLTGLSWLAAAGLAQAMPQTLDFQEFELGETGPVQTKGFTVSGSIVSGGIDPTSEPAEIVIGTNTGTKAFGGYIRDWARDLRGVSARVKIERTDGGVFAVHNFSLWLDSDSNGYTNISGVDADGNIVHLQFTWPGTGAWLSLRSVTFEAYGDCCSIGTADVNIDNIVVSSPATRIGIDVLPGDAANVVYPNRSGKLPVAVLSAADFDATQVDPATLKFGLGEAAPIDPLVISDIDGDFGNDATARFWMPDSGILCNDTEVTLTGSTYTGDQFSGTDVIDATQCDDGGCHAY